MPEKEVDQYTIYGEIRPGEEDELLEILEMLARFGIEPTENQVQNLLRKRF